MPGLQIPGECSRADESGEDFRPSKIDSERRTTVRLADRMAHRRPLRRASSDDPVFRRNGAVFIISSFVVFIRAWDATVDVYDSMQECHRPDNPTVVGA